MTHRVRLEPEAERLLLFLARWNYPHPWALDTLRDHCVRLRVDRDDETVAYLWASWAADFDFSMALDFHACAKPGTPWLSPRVLNIMFTMAELMSADYVVTTPRGPHAPRIERALPLIGFQRNERGQLWRRVDDSNGHLFKTKNSAAASTTASAASGTTLRIS